MDGTVVSEQEAALARFFELAKHHPDLREFVPVLSPYLSMLGQSKGDVLNLLEAVCETVAEARGWQLLKESYVEPH